MSRFISICRWLLILRLILQGPRQFVRSVTGWDGFWWVAGIAAVLVVGVLLSWRFWEELGDNNESLSTTVRNVGLVIGGVIAILLAVWRSTVAARQVDTAQQSLLNERYERGAEMLGNGVLSVRLGGIYALNRLAQEHPEQYHIQIVELFCAFVRHPTKDEEWEALLSNSTTHSPRQDVHAVMQGIGTRNDVQVALEQQAKHKLDLHGADLRNQILHNLNLSESQLSGAKLSDTVLLRTNLSGAHLFDADLSGAKLASVNLTGAFLADANLSRIKECYGTNFSNAFLHKTNLTDADLSGAIVSGARLEGANLAGAKFYNDTGMMVEGLTQRQIAFARAMPENKPPCLDGLDDAESGELISWDKRPTIV